jgi:hypothetical protein
MTNQIIEKKEEQPCENFKSTEETDASLSGNPYIHQCPICGGWRAFCRNCFSDHHKGGWQNCKTKN